MQMNGFGSVSTHLFLSFVERFQLKPNSRMKNEVRRGRETSAQRRLKWKTRIKRKRKFVKVFSFRTHCVADRECVQDVCVCVFG